MGTKSLKHYYCFAVSLLLLAVFSLAPSVVFGASSEWGTYHRDYLRQGVNDSPTQTQDPRNIGLIWTFPRTDVVPLPDSSTVVDISDDDPPAWELSSPMNWNTPASLPNVPGDYYGTNNPSNNKWGFRWARTWSPSDYAKNPNLKITARWYFPDELKKGLYTVQVWFPSAPAGKVNSTSARYTVVRHNAAGTVIASTTFKVDQTDGGQWVTLNSSPVELTPNVGDYVELSNITDDGGADNVIVMADAVRFVPSTSMEIYSSPTAGKADVDGTGDIPVVYIGTIEDAISSLADGVKDFGAVYCVRSYLGSGWDPNAPNWTNPEATGVGTAAWRYPTGGAYDLNPDGTVRSPSNRLPVEGPIGRIDAEGGVFSTPTLVPMSGITGGYALIFGGMDGQVYCVNATTGKLIWKGPGVTIPETQSTVLPNSWEVVPNRYDAFGGSFIQAPVVDHEESSQRIVYDIRATDSDPASDASKTDGSGHYYSVYAWMPGFTSSDAERTKDAAYGVTYWDPVSKSEKTEWVRVDQSSDSTLEDPNIGRWARVGGKYWNPRKIELSTESQAHSTGSRVVVADAIMVVPSEIAGFKYSTIAADNERVYIGNPNGRVYCMALQSSHSPGMYYAGQLLWTYPKVQTKNPIPADNLTEGEASPFGAIVSSPALSNNRLIVSSMDGKVYSIKNLNQSQNNVTLDWIYDARSGSTTGEFGAESFSSSPSIRGNRIYVASTGGRIHAIDFATGERKWVFPDSGAMPFSPFRFSTPATIASTNSIYVASTGGVIYCIDDNGTSASLNINFAQPNLYAPIQSSVALDAATLFVGTMGTGSDGEDGGIWWVNRVSGLAADSGGAVWAYAGYSGMGKVFSSPALANQYIYVGTSKGRLCAFSSEAFGGTWVGGGAGSVPPFQRAEPPNPESSTQVDIYTGKVWYATKKWAEDNAFQLNTKPFGNLIGSTNAGADFFCDASIESDPLNGHKRAFPYASGQPATAQNPREMYFEWGESIYLIAWNLPPLSEIQGSGDATSAVGSAAKRNNVKFRFTNASGGSGSGGTIDAKNADFLYEYVVGDTEKHCFAGAKLDIRGDRSNPPAPGPGWIITVDVTKSSSTSGGTTKAPTGVVPLLSGTPGSWKIEWKQVKGSSQNQWQEQPVGFNNPIAIRDDGWDPSTNGPVQRPPVGIAWPQYDQTTGTFKPNRNDPEAHFNGNGTLINGVYTEKTLRIYLGYGPHGASSRTASVSIMDRSAMGLPGTEIYDSTGKVVGVNRTGQLKSLRVQSNDLSWNGGNDAVVNPLPWDWMPYIDFGIYKSRVQRDYPDISRRNAKFQKSTDLTDPTNEKVSLAAAIPKDINDPAVDYDNARLLADSLSTWVQVPKFQPANFYRAGQEHPGYESEVISYLDSNSNGTFDGGDAIRGRPGTYVEAYRKFNVAVDVPPDYHIVVDHPLTIDIVGPDRAMAPHGLGIGLDPANLAEWYKEFTVQNLGNVNLTNMKVAKALSNGLVTVPMNLYADNVSPFFPLSTNMTLGTGLVSSLDGWDPKLGPIAADPWLTTSGDPRNTLGRSFGFTLSKSRVGEVTPMELTIPDSRKVQEWLGGSVTPIKPSISVRVPIGQPSGSYHALVPVYSDANSNEVLDFGREPFTDPTFVINISVAEDRLTGGATPGSAIQIDPSPTVAPGETKPIFGNTQPAAWRDYETGNIHLFWSSNRFNPSNPPSPNDPWYIAHAELMYDKQQSEPPGPFSWKLAVTDPNATAWWRVPAPGDADYQLPKISWPNMTPDMIESSVKHSAPFAAVNSSNGNVWLFWQGQIDRLDSTTKKITRENRIFYTPATKGIITQPGSIFSFARDLTLTKMNPKAFAVNLGNMENIWLLWHGGDAGRFSIYGNYNQSPANSHDPNAWSPDVVFQTPSCLVSVSDPCPIYRNFGSQTTFMDVVYTGVSKYDQSSDIYLTRYEWNTSTQNPRPTARLLPRVLNEELLRDSKLNVYTSEHIAWRRPPSAGAVDDWGSRTATIPFIRVKLPDGTIISGTDGRVIDPSGTEVSPPTAVAPQVDRATGVYSYTYTGTAANLIGQMLVDYSAGIIRFTKALPPLTKVYADYTPQARRLTRGPESDSAPFAFIEKTPMSCPAVGPCPNPGLQPPDANAPVDRLWLFWRKPTTSGVMASTIYYKTYRVAVELPKPVELGKDGKPTKQVTVTDASGTIPCEVSWDGRKLFFPASAERYPALSGGPGPVTVKYTAKGENSETEVTFDTLTWQEELRDTALPTRQNVNEAQICAFADAPSVPTRIWVFWSSTRAGESDIYYQTISPNFRANY